MRALALLLLAGCTQQGGFRPPKPDSGEEDTGYVRDTSVGNDSDTDGDLDDDGFTPEEGDCDDDDIYVAPNRDEDEDDGKDNDCDGRVDEAWAGVAVAYFNGDGGASEITTIDHLGRVQDEVRIDGECHPIWLDPRGDGWVINNNYAYVSTVDAAGNCADRGDFSDPEVYAYGVYGITTGVDGTLYATTLDKLWTVGEDGTITEVAAWGMDLFGGPEHEVAVYSLAVDPRTGEVGLFGYFGGFALWNPTDGLRVLATEDLAAPAVYTYSGAHRDGGGWYSPGIDAATGTYGVYRFDEGAGAWTLEETWEDEDWVPFAMAIDGDSGDYYVTANAGWYYTVWRIVAGSNYAAQLYSTDGTEPNRAFYGITSLYTYGG